MARLDRYRIGIPRELSEIRTQPWLSERSLTCNPYHHRGPSFNCAPTQFRHQCSIPAFTESDMDGGKSSTVSNAREALETLTEISQLLNTGLGAETLAIIYCVTPEHNTKLEFLDIIRILYWI